MDLSPYTANKLARWFAGQAMPSAPATIYVALWDGDPTSGGTEVGADITGGAARIAIAVATPANDGVANVVASNALADFGASASVTAVDVSFIAIHDAVSSGNVLALKELDTPRSVNENDQVRVQSGDFTLTVQKHIP